MLSWIREKFGTAVIGAIIIMIAGVFVFYGVYSPKSTRGIHEGAVAGKVNGDDISLSEFNRALNQRLEFFKSMNKDVAFTEEQLKAFRVRESVFEGLARRKLLMQEAENQDRTPSTEELKDKIQSMQVFQKEGKFDYNSYRELLMANNFTPGSFERQMKQDLSVQLWEDYFKDRIHVSNEEVKKNFLLEEDKRNIKYVLLTFETGKKAVTVPAEEIKKYLLDPAKLALAKSRFESKKTAEEFKGMTFDLAKEKIAQDILSGEKVEEIHKINNTLADQIIPLLTADKSSDEAVKNLLKPYGADVKLTGLVNELRPMVPGVGEIKTLFDDAFAKKSPIDPTQGGKAKKYNAPGGSVVIAVVSEAQKPDLSKLEASKAKILKELQEAKERQINDAWMQKLVQKAKIEPNVAVIEGG